MAIYLFGYGSMMEIESASRGLGRKLISDDLIRGHIHGFTRSWSVADQVYAENVQQEVKAVFLDVQASSRSTVNGVFIEVFSNELKRLRKREKNYQPIQIEGNAFSTAKPLTTARVFTFTSKPEFRVRKGEPDAFVMRRYLDLIEKACNNLGSSFTEEYTKTTDSFSFEILEGPYRFVDNEQGKTV